MTNEELIEKLADILADAKTEKKQAERKYEDTNHPGEKTTARRCITFNEGRIECVNALAKSGYLTDEVLRATTLKSAANMA